MSRPMEEGQHDLSPKGAKCEMDVSL